MSSTQDVPVRPTREELAGILHDSWRAVCDEQPSLAQFRNRTGSDAFERTQAFRFGLQLQRQLDHLARATVWAANVTVDMELARVAPDGDQKAQGKIPDLVVHRRGDDGPNVLVLELKTCARRSKVDEDIGKLRSLTQPPVNYRFGARGIMDIAGRTLTISHWYEGGENISERGMPLSNRWVGR